MRSNRLRLAGATVVFAVLVAPGGAAAHSGATTASALRGTVSVALRPSAGAVATARAIDAQTGTTAAHGRVGAGGAYRLAAPPGVYLVVVDKVSRRAPFVTGYGRLVRVLPGKTAVVRPIAPGSATRSTAALLAGGGLAPASSDAAAARRPAIAVQTFTGSGPQAHLGRGLTSMLGIDLLGSPCYDVVAWQQADLLAEIRLQQSTWVDPATRVTPRLIQPKVLVEGSVSTTATSVSWNIRIRERATGRVIGTDRGSSTVDGFFTAERPLAKRLRKQLEEELCGDRYTGSFSGRSRESAGGQTAEYTFNGTVTFSRRGPAGAPAGSRTYLIEKIAWTSTIKLSGRCAGTDTQSASLGRDPYPVNMLVVDANVTPGKGRLYRLNFNVHRPTSSSFTATCEGGVTIPYPWSPLAQVVTANALFYTDATAARLRGSYTVPGTPISYTWDLAKGR